MKEFLQILRRFIPPYKKYLALTVVFNILSAVLNIFSFAALIPILQILFRTEEPVLPQSLCHGRWTTWKEVLANNADYYVTQLIGDVGATTTLLLIGLFLAFATFLKTRSLLPFLSHNHTHSYGCGTRHPQPALP